MGTWAGNVTKGWRFVVRAGMWNFFSFLRDCCNTACSTPLVVPRMGVCRSEGVELGSLRQFLHEFGFFCDTVACEHKPGGLTGC